MRAARGGKGGGRTEGADREGERAAPARPDAPLRARRSRAGPAGRYRAARPLRLLRPGPVQQLPRRPAPAGLPAAAAGGAGGEHGGEPGRRGTGWGGPSRPGPRPRPPLSPQVPPERCSAFDPAFSAQEAAALEQLGLRLLPDNEVSGARRAAPPAPVLRGPGARVPRDAAGHPVRSPPPGLGCNGNRWFTCRRGNTALRDRPRCFTWCTAGKPSTTTSCGGTGPQRHCPKWSSSGTASKALRNGGCSPPGKGSGASSNVFLSFLPCF